MEAKNRDRERESTRDAADRSSSRSSTEDDRLSDRVSEPVASQTGSGDDSRRPTHPLVGVQRRRGNRTVQRLFRDGVRLGNEEDASAELDEREADRTARRVTRSPSAPSTPPPLVGGQSRNVRRQTADAGSTESETPPLTGSGGGGRPIPASIRHYFEPRLGHDFGEVRLHTGARAAAVSESMDARAFTYGTDIYFGANSYRPETAAGRELVAHELTHVVQQSTDAMPRIQRRNGEDEDTADQGPALDPASRTQLHLRGIELDASQEEQLATAFPLGFTLGDERTTYVLGVTESGTQSVRLPAVRVVEPPPLMTGTEALIFKVGKGRAILVQSVGGVGGGVMLDAGTGSDVTGTSAAVQRLAETVRRASAVRLAGEFNRFNVSHLDTDHFNAVESILRASQMQRATIEVTRQQLQQASHTAWDSLTMNLRPGQEIVEIDVAGTGGGRRAGPAGGEVHIRRLVIGNFELTEFRSVEAHRQLTETDRATYNKNRTSPVTIVKDLVTGQRMLFTADAEMRQFTEAVDAVGAEAFRRLLGAEGRNLRLVEEAHHGGRVQGGPNVRGMILKLRLAFEASDGTTRFVTQTTESFASGASASIRFLDSAGVNVERVMGDPSPEGRSEVVRARGSELETVSFDARRIRRVVRLAREHEPELMRAARRRHEVQELRWRVEPLHEAYTQGGAPSELRTSTERIKGELDRVEQSIRERVNRVFETMETISSGSQGMRAGREMGPLREALRALVRHVESVNLQLLRQDVEAHEASLNAYGRAFQTMFAMFQALQAERWTEVNRLRGVYEARLQEARAVLGRAEVHEHVRAAWKATRSHWTGHRIQEVAARLGRASRAHRIMMAEFRVELLQSLGRQMRLNEMMGEAMHGGVRGGTAPVPVRTRVGAGALAAIEVIRIGLELAESAREASEAREATEARARATGARTAMWWIQQGTRPELALVDRGFWGGYEVVSSDLSQQQILRIAAGEATDEEVPEYEKVVVTDVESADLERMIYTLFLELRTLEDWTRFNSSNPSGSAFRRFDQGWGVRLWDTDEGEHHYVFVSAIQQPLEDLHDHLEAAQREQFERDVAQAESGAVETVEDTGWFQNLRRVFVFTSGGGLKRLDFDETEPRFVRVGTETVRGTRYAKVRAVDMPTFRRLSRYYWREYSHDVAGANHWGPVYNVFRNADGYALVHEDELESTKGTRTFESETRTRADRSE